MRALQASGPTPSISLAMVRHFRARPPRDYLLEPSSQTRGVSLITPFHRWVTEGHKVTQLTNTAGPGHGYWG